MVRATKEQCGRSLFLADQLERPFMDGAPSGVKREAANLLRLLSADSERLAAIEAATGEEVKRLLSCGHTASDVFFTKGKEALLALSAKVAEQTGEIERLESAFGGLAVNRDGWKARAEAAEAKCKELELTVGMAKRVHEGARYPLQCAVNRLTAERDALRRLLTETAVPALEYFQRQGWETATEALATIRAQMGGGNG